jgi:hypothetical protein
MTVSGSAPSDAADLSNVRPTPIVRGPLPAASRVGAILALLYLIGHLFFLPPALEDIDSINFALGLHDYDPTQHQPHPPGYPVYIALGKVARAGTAIVWPGLPAEEADARALAVWSALAGAAVILLMAPLVGLLGRLTGDADAVSRLTPALVVLMASPLFWMSGLRPLSDMPGLAAAIGAQVVLLRACAAFSSGDARPGPWQLRLFAGAIAAGLAIGVRSQVVWLTAPLLLVVVFWHRRAGLLRAAAVVVGGLAFGMLVWAVPMVTASGGARQYFMALEAMAGQDFANVQMLGMNPTLRGLAVALVDTFVKPWGHQALASVVLATALAGTLLLALRRRRLLAWLLVLFGPYLAMHLLFQETLHTRYALPLVVPVACACVWMFGSAGPRAAMTGAAALAVASLAVCLPVVLVYANGPLPAGAVVAGAIDGQRREGGVIANHFEFGRAIRVSSVNWRAVLLSPEFAERLELVSYLRQGGRGPVWFVAAPARTDLDLVDPAARHVLSRPAWRFSPDWFLGGIRPARAALVRIDPPGWIAGEGWHLTREALILSERRARPAATMLVGRRDVAAVAFIGGEYLAATGQGPMTLTVALDGRDLSTIQVPSSAPRFFMTIPLPAGSLSGEGPYATLDVAWRAGIGDPAPRVQVTQFDLQPADRTFWVFSHGWHDREYDARQDREWRWSSGRAELRIHTAGRDVEMKLGGEVPIGDLDGAPTVTIGAGALMLETIRPQGRFATTVRVPAGVLDAAGGVLTIATDRTFIPDERTGNGDRRQLGLRVFELRVNPLQP